MVQHTAWNRQGKHEETDSKRDAERRNDSAAQWTVDQLVSWDGASRNIISVLNVSAAEVQKGGRGGGKRNRKVSV